MIRKADFAVTDKEANILIVDDDQAFADTLAEHLVERGYTAKVAYDGNEGLERYRSGAYHVIFTDLQMPGMDGMELLHEIKKADSRSVVVVITGFGTIEGAVQAIKKGAYDFITKPVKFEELDIVVDRALEKRGLVKQLDFFRGLTLAVLISIPVWLILGIILASKLF
ncbi:MAG: response regulator [Deltaproteobacteria bacterium]|nr:response regulator [Deltaproteobacteria bacterium]